MKTKKVDFVNAQGAAFELINLFYIDKPEDIVLTDIAMARGVFVFEGILEGADARLIREGDKGIIRVNSNIHNIGRKRFSIAHELGHWELHPTISQLDLYTETNFEEYKTNPMEQEADIFASELLMPTKLFRSLCVDITPNFKAIQSLADKFRTSLSATALRFIDETNHPCIIVFSQNGTVKWWKRNRKCESVWIKPRQNIHRSSLAYDCEQNKAFPENGKTLDSKVWFLDDNNRNIRKVFEQSINLGYNSTVMTLLLLL